jgi:hypothetical protein
MLPVSYVQVDYRYGSLVVVQAGFQEQLGPVPRPGSELKALPA